MNYLATMMTSSLSDRSFTDAAQTIVQQIRQRAGDRGLFYVDDAVIVCLALWTLIRWERKVGLAALEIMGIDLHSLADRLDALLTRFAREHPVMGKDGALVFIGTGEPVTFDITAAVQPLLDQAEAEARRLNHNYVGTEHLLLAIIALADSELSAILRDHFIAYDCTKETVLELLR